MQHASNKCPCGQPLEIQTVRNLSFNCEAEVITCPCGKIRESHEPNPMRAKFIQNTYKMMKVEVPDKCKSNEVYIDKFKALADSL